MNVLSLFDGISCGRVALERAGVKVDKYYSSEIDEKAMIVAHSNYPDIIQLGNIEELTDDKLDEIGHIDIVIGGSPCQNLSIGGDKTGLEGSESKLFFEYVRIRDYLQKKNPNLIYFLENVKMKKEWKDIMSEHVGSDPYLVDSMNFSAQKRERFYWTNIDVDIDQILSVENNQYLKDIVEDNPEEKFYLNDEYHRRFNNSRENIRDKKFPTSKTLKVIGTTVNDIAKGTNSRHWVHSLDSKVGALSATEYKQPKQFLDKEGRLRRITPLEAERLQTLPEGYTEGISNTQRYRAIGNGWTVDVIAEFFKYIK